MNQPALNIVSDQSGSARFSTAEFIHMVDVGAFGDMRVELIDGRLERMPPPKNAHAELQLRLVSELLKVVSRTLLRGEIGIALDDDSLIACDAALLRDIVDEDRMLIGGDVLLVAEVAVSTIDRDLGMKRLVYAGAGIDHYWVLDAARSVTHVFGRQNDGDYLELQLIPFSSPLAVPGTDATITIA